MLAINPALGYYIRVADITTGYLKAMIDQITLERYAKQIKLSENVSIISKMLRGFANSNGLIPFSVRKSAKFIDIRNKYEIADKALIEFNKSQEGLELRKNIKNIGICERQSIRKQIIEKLTV